jgi:hypothetical protein
VDETQNGEVVCVSKIWNEEIVCRCVSFIKLIDDKISRLDEYWGDVTEVPEWRRKMNIGETISKAVFK